MCLEGLAWVMWVEAVLLKDPQQFQVAPGAPTMRQPVIMGGHFHVGKMRSQSCSPAAARSLADVLAQASVKVPLPHTCGVD
jgi:hypothetical protein